MKPRDCGVTEALSKIIVVNGLFDIFQLKLSIISQIVAMS